MGFESLTGSEYNYNMYYKSKKISLIILGITALIGSRLWFTFLNDPEGPNLVVVLGMTAIIYCLSLAFYLLYPPTAITGIKRVLFTIFVQIIVLTGFYFLLS